MANKIQITIPRPCHENWQDMSADDKGRFCASCQKKVYDFTAATDREIVTVLNREKDACGRFTVQQLNRDLAIPKEKKGMWMAASAAVISIFTLGNHEAAAQTPVPVEQRPQTPDYSLGKYMIQPKTVTGRVTDASGMGISKATVTVKNTKNSVLTDMKGDFSIKADDADVLIFSYIGFRNQEINIHTTSNITVVMKEEIMGDINIVQKRTFFEGVLNSIENLFR